MCIILVAIMTIDEILLTTPGVVNFSRDNKYEVKPRIFSPIYIDIKNILPNYTTRRRLVNRLAKVIGKEPDCICGVKSGGAYFASATADILHKRVIYWRKDNKDCGDRKKITGPLPEKGKLIAVVDDVIATGLTISQVVVPLREMGYQTKVYAIFSYGADDQISKHLQVDITAVTNFEKLIVTARKMKIFSKVDVNYLRKHISTYSHLLKNL